MNRGILSAFLILIVAGLFYTACDNNSTAPSFESSIDMVIGLEPVSGTENSKIQINKGTDQGVDSWFVFEIDEMQPNGIVGNGVAEGWCVEWNKPIKSDGTIHQNKMSYSTFGKDKYKPLNYFLSIKDQLRAEDPSLTFREIQATIWSLVAEPKFDLNKLTNEELPARLKTSDGTPDFSKQKVLAMVDKVMTEVDSFEYKWNKPTAVMHDMGNDKQVVITLECDETAWAANGDVPGDLRYQNPGNWATYVEYNGSEKTVTLFAGQTTNIGTVTFSAPSNDKVTIKIELNEEGGFANISENVKIQDYKVAPSGNPAPGQFDHKADASGKTYEIEVPLNNYYGVHVDALTECGEEDDDDDDNGQNNNRPF